MMYLRYDEGRDLIVFSQAGQSWLCSLSPASARVLVPACRRDVCTEYSPEYRLFPGPSSGPVGFENCSLFPFSVSWLPFPMSFYHFPAGHQFLILDTSIFLLSLASQGPPRHPSGPQNSSLLNVPSELIHSVVSCSLQPYGLHSPWSFPGQNTGVGSISLLQGIFPNQRLNPGLPNCRWILYELNHKGSPGILEWVAYPFSSGSSQPRT